MPLYSALAFSPDCYLRQSCSLLQAGVPYVADGFSMVMVVWGRQG